MMNIAFDFTSSFSEGFRRTQSRSQFMVNGSEGITALECVPAGPPQ